jgi:hypothetical protein
MGELVDEDRVRAGWRKRLEDGRPEGQDLPRNLPFAAARRRVASDLFHESGHILFLDPNPLRLALVVGVQPFPATQTQVALDGILHDFFRASLLDVRRSLQLGHQRLGDPDTAV